MGWLSRPQTTYLGVRRVPKIACESSGRIGLTPPPGITSSIPIGISGAPTTPSLGLTILIPVQAVEKQQQALFPLLQVLAKLFQVQTAIWVSTTLWGEALAWGKGQRELQEAAPPFGKGITSLHSRNPGLPPVPRGQGQGNSPPPSISLLLSKMSKSTEGL